MSSGSRSAPAVGVDRLQPGDHAFLAFSDDEERWEILSTFTRQGLAREEKVFLLLDVQSPAEAAARAAGSVAAARRRLRRGVRLEPGLRGLRRQAGGRLPGHPA